MDALVAGGAVAGGPLVLLSLFDGIGGAAAALRRAGAEPAAFYSSEVDSCCMRVVSERCPGVVHVGDVRKLSRDRLAEIAASQPADALWLVVGGSPCQDLSILRGAGRKGLDGPKSKLFWEFVRVVAQLSRIRRVAFLLENVASMREADRDAISAALGVRPVTLDAAPWCGCRRLRHYWTNVAAASAPTPPAEAVRIDEALDPGWTRPENKPFRCFVSSAARTSGKCRMLSGEVVRGDESREPNADEREALLGLPRGYTALDGMQEQKRLRMVGNGFAVPVVAELLRPVARWAAGENPELLRPVCPTSLVARMDRMAADQQPSGGLCEEEMALSWD